MVIKGSGVLASAGLTAKVKWQLDFAPIWTKNILRRICGSTAYNNSISIYLMTQLVFHHISHFFFAIKIGIFFSEYI